jgi:fluoroquinolone transport system permease protein
MRSVARYRALVRTDLRNVWRDDLLAAVAVVPLLIALLFRLGVPPLAALLARELAFDLVPYYGLLMSFLVLMAPTMIGMLVGFLLLDERDGGVLTALQVTPMPLGGYLAYRASGLLALGLVATMIAYPLAGLAPLPLADLLVIAILASLSGPVVALFLAGFAENKVTGFAMVKVLNLIAMVPIGAYFLPEPWHWAAGVVPTFWPLKMTWLATAGKPYLALLVPGLLVYAAVTAALLRQFKRRVTT